MRYILLKRRRLWVIFIFLLLALSVSALMVSWPHLLNDFKLYARKEIAKNFNVEVDIGEVTGGLISPLTFENLCVTKKKNAQNFISFKAKTSLPDYRMWDLFLAQIYGYRQFALIFSSGELYVNSEEPLLSGIEGKLEINKNRTILVNLIARHNSDKILLAGEIKNGLVAPDMNLKVAYIKQLARLDVSLMGVLEKLSLCGSLFLPEGKKVDFKTNLSVEEKEIRMEDVEIDNYYAAEGIYKIKENNFSGRLSYLENRENYLAVDFNLPALLSSLNEETDKETAVVERESSSEEKLFLKETNEVKEKSAETNAENLSAKPFSLKLQFNHFNLFGRDVMSFVEIQGALFVDEKAQRLAPTLKTADFMGEKGGKISFKLLTYGTIIDHRPASELEISCNYEDGILDIGSIQLGKEHFTYGAVDFNHKPPQLNLTWQVTDMDLTNLLVLSDDKSGSARLAGKLDGKIQLEGSLFNPFVKIALKSKEGKFLSMDFASANVNINGNYPMLAFHDSRIYREEGGFFIIDGKIDLRNMHTLGLFDNVKILTDEKTIVLDGWDISRGAEQAELNLKKAVSEDLKVGFKAFINNQTPALSDEANSLELEYKLQENRALLMRFEKEGEFLGVKQGAKF